MLIRNEADVAYFNALATRKPDYPVSAVAVAGKYRMRFPSKDSPWCPVSIAELYEVDEDGTQVGDSTFEITVSGQPVSAEVVWPYAGRFPIPQEEYVKMMQSTAALDQQLTAQGQAMLPYTSTQADQSTLINELAGALAKAQGAVEGASKDTANPFFKSKYADLSSVWTACRQALSSNGLAVTQTTEAGTGDAVTVVTTLMHSSGQWIRGRLTMRPVKADPQGIGSCITYIRRYSLAAMVGVAPEDDDGEGASGRQTKPERPVQQTGRYVDDGLMRAQEWANATLDAIQKGAKTPAHVQSMLGTPKTQAAMQKLHDSYPDIYEKLMADIARREQALMNVAAA